MSIRARISLGFACICFLFVITVVITSRIADDIDGRMQRIIDVRVPTTVSSMDLNIHLQEATSALRGWLMLGEPAYKKTYAGVWMEIEHLAAKLDDMSREWNDPARLETWQRCKRLLDEFRSIQDRIAAVAHTPEARPGLELFVNQNIPLQQTLYRATNVMLDSERQLQGAPARKALFGLMGDLRGTLSDSQIALQTYLLTGDRSYLANFDDVWERNGARVDALRGQRALLSPDQREALEDYEIARDELGRIDQQLIAARAAPTWDMPNYLMVNEVYVVRDQLFDILAGAKITDGTRHGGIMSTETHLLMEAQIETLDQVLLLMYTTWGLLAGGLILSVAVAWLASRSITAPVSRLVTAMSSLARGETAVDITDTDRTDELGLIARSVDTMALAMRSVSQTCEAISSGDLSGKVEVRSDNDQLARSVNRMVDTFQEIVAQANAISQGDYDCSIAVRGKKDELGAALAHMTAALRRAAARNQRDTWMKTGQREVIESIQGEHDISALSRRIVTAVARYIDAQVGVLYVSSSAGTLRLTGSYAHVRRKRLKAEVRPGEGLVGQAALEKQSIIITSVPDSYITIDSGLGSETPRNLAVIPLLSGQEVRGVIELGKVQPFTETERELLEAVSENIAIGLASAQHFARTQELLQETQHQSQVLLQQSEKLRAANEELARQAAQLEQSQKELQSQSEALRVTNEELEEQATQLQRQKQEISDKNSVLEKARQELTEKARQLEQTSRYKSEFLANMSHELRTPLNSLLILSKLLAENEDKNLTDEQINAAQVIYSGGKDLLELINDILDLSKVEAGMLDIAPESVPLDVLCSRIRTHFGPTAADKHLGFSVHIAPGMPEALITDRLRLEQILRNLLSNAFKFTATGSIRLHICRPAPGVILGGARRGHDDVIAFEVIDTGIGIPMNKQEEIFEAFKQADGSTSRQYGGTGLGLTISRELARLLGGEIHLRSREGEGSTFTLYLPARGLTSNNATHDLLRSDGELLPLRPQAPAPVAAVAPAAVTDDRHDLRDGDRIILIIEDDPVFAGTLSRLCREHGYKCVIAQSGVTGVRMAADIEPSAIFLDLALPDIDGLIVLEQLKFDLGTRHIPVHIISAREEGTGVMQRGAIGCARKPVTVEDIDTLLARVEQHLATRLKTVLIIEDNAAERDAITQLIENDDIEIHTAATGKQALDILLSSSFDCVILDLQIPDMSGFDLLRALSTIGAENVPPIIVYTGRELTRKEHLELSQYTASIVIKGANSPERLLDEASLFLHSVASSLPPSQRTMIRTLHDPDEVLRGRTIMLVDDDLRNAFALSGMLKKHGIEVVLADNGQLALEKLATEARIDLIVMDVMMPQMDGCETMRRIRSDPRHQSTPIIALTAKAMAEDRATCLEAGANDYLTKPVDIDQLISLLRVWLFGRNERA